MELFLVLFSAAGAAAGAAYMFYQQARRSALAQVGALRGVAKAAGLTEAETSWAGMFSPTTTLTGRYGALRVALSTVLCSAAPEGEEDRVPRLSNIIAIHGMGHRQDDLAIDPETFSTGVGKALGAREVELGDPTFDQNIYLRGSEPLIYALFDHETRRQVVGLLLWSDTVVSLANGTLRVEIPDTLDVPSWLAEKVTSVLEVARRLARPADIASRLAANLRSDPTVTVRLHNLEILVREYPGRPATMRALRAALDDPTIEVRFRAAMALGDEGYEALLAFASADDGQAEAALAIEALGKRLPLERARDVLDRALRTRRLAVARACLEALGERGEAECVEPLARVLAIEKGELAEAAARALGTAERPEAEAPLTAALGHRDDAVKRAAAVALGRCGSAAAVAPLRRLESASQDNACRRATRQAVAGIQERLTGASPGQLSLTEGESGQLSLARDEAGRVSLPDDEE